MTKKTSLNEPVTKGEVQYIVQSELKKEFKKYDNKIQKQLDEDFGQVYKRFDRIESQIKHLIDIVSASLARLENHEQRIQALENS